MVDHDRGWECPELQALVLVIPLEPVTMNIND